MARYYISILAFLCISFVTTVVASTPTTPMTPSATLTDEQKQLLIVRSVIEHGLSSERCKTAIQSAIQENITLAQGCYLLEQAHPQMSNIGCTNEDYAKLHQVICEYNANVTASDVSDKLQEAGLSSQCQTSILGVLPESITVEVACGYLNQSLEYLPSLGCNAEDSTKLSRICGLDTTTSTNTDEQSQRAYIKSIIENELSSDQCKSAVLPQVNDNMTLTAACDQLEAFQALVLIFCSKDDYNILHRAICEYKDIQRQRAFIEVIIESELSSDQCKDAVQPQVNDNITLIAACRQLESSQQFGLLACSNDDYTILHRAICDNGEESQRDYIKSIIANDLSSSRCKDTVQSQVNDNMTLEDACTQLQSFKTLVLAICTSADYDKLHQAICGYSSHTGSSTTPAPVSSEEEKQQELARSVIENDLSSVQCKTTIQNAIPEGITLKKACEMLELAKPLMSSIGCNEEDYGKLHKVICEYEYYSCNNLVKGFDVQKWKVYVMSVTDNKLSQTCSPLIKSFFSVNMEPKEACQNLTSQRDAISAKCSEKDLEELNDAICEYRNRTEMAALQNAVVVIDTRLSGGCRNQVRGQKAFLTDLDEACHILEVSGEWLVSNQHCTTNDIKLLVNAFCFRGANCSDPEDNGNGESNGNTNYTRDTRDGRVRSVIAKLTTTCNIAMSTAVSEWLKPAKDACDYFMSSESAVKNGKVCTELDLAMLRLVVCDDTPDGTDMGAVDDRRERALNVMYHNLSSTCHDYIWPKNSEYLENLETGCSQLKKVESALVKGGTCTLEDYQLLQGSVCAAASTSNDKNMATKVATHGFITTAIISLLSLAGNFMYI